MQILNTLIFNPYKKRIIFNSPLSFAEMEKIYTKIFSHDIISIKYTILYVIINSTEEKYHD
jgi:hypothetical protein